jgi:hypothetical protein
LDRTSGGYVDPDAGRRYFCLVRFWRAKAVIGITGAVGGGAFALLLGLPGAGGGESFLGWVVGLAIAGLGLHLYASALAGRPPLGPG